MNSFLILPGRLTRRVLVLKPTLNRENSVGVSKGNGFPRCNFLSRPGGAGIVGGQSDFQIAEMFLHRSENE